MRLHCTIKLLLGKLAWALAFLVSFKYSMAQSQKMSPGTFSLAPKGYIAQYVKDPPLIDGNIEDPVWQQAVWSDDFMDIEGQSKPAPSLKTRVKMLWNDSCLFVAAALDDPHVWATLKKHDAIVYYDNDFEVFLDPDNDTHDYFEIEVNAYNTIFDLFLPKPYRNGGKALIPFDIVSLQSAVHVQGTLNDPADQDSGWTVEMAIPFRSVTFGNTWKAPAEGTMWRINFSRVHWDLDVVNGAYRKRKNNQGRNLREHNWVWSPQGIINMHFPERWGYLQFTRNVEKNKIFALSYQEKQKQLLWSVYYRQKEFFSKYEKYAPALSDLGWNMPALEVDGVKNKIKLEATSRQFAAYISDDHEGWSIDEDGKVKHIK